MENQFQEIERKKKIQARRARILTGIHFSVSLAVFSFLGWVIVTTFLNSGKNIIEYICFFVSILIAGLGVLGSFLGLISLCKSTVKSNSVTGLLEATLHIAIWTGALILIIGLFLMVLDFLARGPTDATPYLLFLLKVESPFILVCLTGWLSHCFIEGLKTLDLREKNLEYEAMKKNKKRRVVPEKKSFSRREDKEEVSLATGMSTDVTEGSYAKAPLPEYAS